LDGDRSVPAGGAGVWSDARLSGGISEEGRAERLDHHQVEPDRADIDVLQRIAERSNLGIDITITTLRAGLTRLLEPRAPRPRFAAGGGEAVTRSGASRRGLGFTADPGITDRDGDLEAVAAAAKGAGAQWFFSGVLFLIPTLRTASAERRGKLSAAREQYVRVV